MYILTRQFLLLLLCSIIFLDTAYSQGIPSKRGIASTNIHPADLDIMSGRIAWWYNWSTEPTNIQDNSPNDRNVDYVPMTHRSDFDETALRQYLDNHPNVEYLLAFNEPNFVDQANLTPQELANIWPRLESIADDYQLQLISAAVNYSPGEVNIPNTEDNGSPFAYLDAFFEACPHCRVDYIAVHSYMASVDSFKQNIRQFYERYHKPVWVTEWNLSLPEQTETLEQQMNYMAETVRWMDQSDEVFRYAWFVGRSSHGSQNWPYMDLLDAPGQWSILGKLYQGIQSPQDYRQIPAVIQAQDAITLSGFTHRVSDNQDIQLFSKTGSQSQTLSYQIDVKTPRSYNLTLHYAAQQYSEVTILVDGTAQKKLSLWNTGSIYYWADSISTINIPFGQHTITLQVNSGKPNFDWLKFE